MTSLREVQQRFCAAVFTAPEIAPPDFIVGGHLTAGERMASYRGSVFGNLLSALRGVYPVVDRLVGAEFFDFAARHFIRAFPSPSGDVHQFGCQFADFLTNFSPVAGQPYLPDVARLEWLAHTLYYQPELPPLDIAALAALPQQTHDRLSFAINPACGLLASLYPIDRIWLSNQPEVVEPEPVELDVGGVCLLVRRRCGQLELQRLGMGGGALLTQLQGRATFTVALEQALSAQADFDAVPFLLQQVQQGTLVAFYQT